MDKITLHFLGTGNAVPTKLRNHPAILLSYKNENILIDCGEGTQRQFRKLDLSPAKVTKILLTHWHGDHVLGLPGLFETLELSEYKKQLKIYGPRGTNNNISNLKNMIRSNLNISSNEIENSSINDKEYLIETKSMAHGIPANGYSFVIKDKIRLKKQLIKKLKIPNSPLLGELQKGKDIVFEGKKIKAKDLTYVEKGKKVTIILDTGMNKNAIELAKNSDILIIESTFASDEKARAIEYNHLTASDAATIAKKSKSKLLILTHISQRYEHNTKIIEKEAKKIFKNVKIVKDLDKITI